MRYARPTRPFARSTVWAARRGRGGVLGRRLQLARPRGKRVGRRLGERHDVRRTRRDDVPVSIVTLPDGYRLNVEQIGDGFPLVVLHGGPGLDHTMFRPWLDP